MLKKINEMVVLMAKITGGANTHTITEQYGIHDDDINFCLDHLIPDNIGSASTDQQVLEHEFCVQLKKLPMVYRMMVIDLFICLENEITHAIIERGSSTAQGTPGKLTTNGFECCTMECPDYDNEPNFSCVPVGVYDCAIVKSKKYGLVYTLEGVEDRTKIRIHWGNWAGDTRKGYLTDSKGCILTGNKIVDDFLGQVGVYSSVITYNKFMQHMAGARFKLFIVGVI